MKKTIRFCVFVCFVLLCSLTLISCGDKHVHAYTKENHDEIEHWHECECGEIDEKKSHTYGQWVDSSTEKKRVCTECGYEQTSSSIAHTFTEEVIAPTCTEKGYTKKVCSECGLEVLENYKDPLGHQGVTICDVCGEKILDNAFFDALITSFEENNIALKVNNLNAKIYSDDYWSSLDITFAEFLFTVTEEGEVIGYGSFDSAYGYPLFKETLKGSAILKNDKLYMKADTTTDLSQDSFSSSWEATIENKRTLYEVYDVTELNEIKTIVELVKELPVLTQVIKENENKLSLALSGVFPKVFNRDSIEGGYKFTLDFNKLVDLIDKACSLKISELIDVIFGEGVFEQIETIVPNLFDYTIDETMDLLEGLGLTLVDLFDVLDAMIKENMGEEYNLKAILVMISGKEELDGTALEILRSPLFKDVTLKQLFANFNLDTDELKPMLETYIAMAKEYTLLDLLQLSSGNETTSEEEINIKEILSLYINEYGKDLDISIYTDVKGNLLRLGLAGKVAILTESETQEAELDVEILPKLDLTKDYASLEEELKKKTTIDWDKFAEVLSEAGYEIVKEDGTIVAFQKVEVNEETKQTDIGKDMYCVSTTTHTLQKRYNLEDITITDFSENCDNWIEAIVSLEATVTSTFETTEKYYENDVFSHENAWDGRDSYSSSDSLSLYFNLETNEYKLSEDQHDFILDETKSKEPTGCTDIGKLHYVCSKCGQEKITYYTNGHSDFTYSYEFLTDLKNCRAGVLINEYCGKCKELAFSEKRDYHYDIGYSIDLGDAKICEDHTLKFYECPCGEERGFYCDLRFDGSVYQCETCGLTITAAEDTKLEGCFSTTTYTYTFYIDEEEVKKFEYEIVKNRHFYDQIECEILNNGLECDAGWVLTGHCKTCDQIIVETGSMHKTYNMKRIDLREFGGEGFLIIQSCPCGLDYRISQNGFLSQYSSETDQEENTYYICNNNPSFIIKEEQAISYKGHYVSITHTFYIGYDRETGSYLDFFSINQLRY
ncbi:MAG: hypothetical protein K2I88_01395 [Anaeroplasmataceae bacterium]|nr:hypothetical protein [Anaeroplasmataceae bacterium]